MRSRLAPLLGLVVLVACGDDEDAAETSGTGPGTTTQMATAGSTSTDGTTTEGMTTGEGTEGGTAGSSGGAMDGVEYSAVLLATDPPQLHVRRKDGDNDRCTWIILTDQSVGLLAIATPNGWTPQAALTNDNPDSCDEPDPLVGGSQQASSGMGDITEAEAGSGAAPCALDVEAEIGFPQLDLVEVFSATGVPVQGC